MRTRRPAPVDPHRATAASPVEILRAALRAATAGGDAARIDRARRTLAAYEAREAERVAFVASFTTFATEAA